MSDNSEGNELVLQIRADGSVGTQDNSKKGLEHLSGIRALMLAVLEDGIGAYLRGGKLARAEAENWIFSPSTRSPFAFVAICEIFSLDPSATRAALRQIQTAGNGRRMPRSRPNVRPSGTMRKGGQ